MIAKQERDPWGESAGEAEHRATRDMTTNREKMTPSIGFAVAMAILIVNAAVSAWNVRNVAANNRLVAHSIELISELKALDSTAKDAETGQRGFLITGRDA